MLTLPLGSKAATKMGVGTRLNTQECFCLQPWTVITNSTVWCLNVGVHGCVWREQATKAVALPPTAMVFVSVEKEQERARARGYKSLHRAQVHCIPLIHLASAIPEKNTKDRRGRERESKTPQHNPCCGGAPLWLDRMAIAQVRLRQAAVKGHGNMCSCALLGGSWSGCWLWPVECWSSPFQWLYKVAG